MYRELVRMLNIWRCRWGEDDKESFETLKDGT